MACGSLSALSPTVRALQDDVTEGGSEVLVEEREDDCPHLCDCFYHRPLHRAFCHWRHPNLGNPSLPALLLGHHLPWCMPRGALSPVLLHVECCSVLLPCILKLMKAAMCYIEKITGIKYVLFGSVGHSSTLISQQYILNKIYLSRIMCK